MKALLASIFRRAASSLSSPETAFNGVWISGEEGDVELDKEGDDVADRSLIFYSADLESHKFFQAD